MKLNLIIRTHKVNNLYLSLFDLPNKISSDDVSIYVHNDNPLARNEFDNIISEFKDKYSDYELVAIQEDQHQHMLYSIINSIEYLDSNNKFTMLLDDDDSLCNLSDDILNYINSFDELTQLSYPIIVTDLHDKHLYESTYINRINPTSLLKLLFSHKDKLTEALLNQNGSTKFAADEDILVNRLISKLGDIKVHGLSTPIIYHRVYDHEYENYISGPTPRKLPHRRPRLMTDIVNEFCELINK